MENKKCVKPPTSNVYFSIFMEGQSPTSPVSSNATVVTTRAPPGPRLLLRLPSARVRGPGSINRGYHLKMTIRSQGNTGKHELINMINRIHRTKYGKMIISDHQP